MGSVDANVLERLDGLVTKGETVLRDRMRVPDLPGLYIDSGLYAGWRAQSLNALVNLLGENHTYVRSFTEQVNKVPTDDGEVRKGIGILRSVRDDAASGHLLTRLAGLLSAEIFSDFLDMAQHLLQQHYWIPAAAVTGAVLEDTLRRVADTNHVVVKNSSITTLNDGLSQAGMYSKVVWRQVQVWGDIRNAADHGEFARVTEQQVSEMYRGVSAFVAQQLR